MKTEITSLQGLLVYTDKGKYVGKVQDLTIDPVERRISGLVVVDFNRDLFDLQAKGIIIPYRWVSAVGDIVLIKHAARKPKSTPTPS